MHTAQCSGKPIEPERQLVAGVVVRIRIHRITPSSSLSRVATSRLGVFRVTLVEGDVDTLKAFGALGFSLPGVGLSVTRVNLTLSVKGVSRHAPTRDQSAAHKPPANWLYAIREAIRPLVPETCPGPPTSAAQADVRGS